MTPADAARLLELPVDASPERAEARFNELRAKLEEKIGKAPTPGLKAKYRESLDEITQAFETLTLAADGSALPVIQKQGAGSKEQGVQTSRSQDSGTAFSPSSKRPAPSSSRPKSGGKEFALVAIIAVVVLGVGGWFVLKTRAENAEQARVAAGLKAEAERKTEEARIAAEHTKAGIEKQLTRLRGRLAELNVQFDAALRSEARAEQILADLQSESRDGQQQLASAAPPNVQALIITAKSRAVRNHLQYLRGLLPEHPAKRAQVRAMSLLEAQALEEAGAAVAGFERQVAELMQAVAASAPDLWQIERDTGQAAASLLRWHRAAGTDELARHLATVFAQDPTGIPMDEKAALDWLMASAKRGDSKAAYLVGICWLAGRIQGDSFLGWVDGRRVIQYAAEQGNCPEAHVWMGRDFFKSGGFGILMAASHFKKAAEAGNADGQYEWGTYLTNVHAAQAKGVATDPRAAVEWLTKAANQNHAAAQYRLGLSYAEGQGVAANRRTATDWMRKAARLGEPNAQAYLRSAGQDW